MEQGFRRCVRLSKLWDERLSLQRSRSSTMSSTLCEKLPANTRSSTLCEKLPANTRSSSLCGELRAVRWPPGCMGSSKLSNVVQAVQGALLCPRAPVPTWNSEIMGKSPGYAGKSDLIPDAASFARFSELCEELCAKAWTLESCKNSGLSLSECCQCWVCKRETKGENFSTQVKASLPLSRIFQNAA